MVVGNRWHFLKYHCCQRVRVELHLAQQGSHWCIPMKPWLREEYLLQSMWVNTELPIAHIWTNLYEHVKLNFNLHRWLRRMGLSKRAVILYEHWVTHPAWPRTRKTKTVIQGNKQCRICPDFLPYSDLKCSGFASMKCLCILIFQLSRWENKEKRKKHKNATRIRMNYSDWLRSGNRP